MDFSEFRKIGFAPGMGFDVIGDPSAHVLVACDFETGECEDFEGLKFSLDRVERFFFYDGTPLVRRS